MNKYNAKKTNVDGIEFDSQKEANRYCELKLMQRANLISNLRMQVKYELVPKQVNADGKTERSVDYIADFVYREKGKDIDTVEDVKGYRDPKSVPYAKFVIKKKLMLYFHGITVKEI